MERKDFIKGALAGAVIGSVATALTTPKRGSEVRDEIKHAPDKAKDAFFEKIGSGAEKLNIDEVSIRMKNGEVKSFDPTSLSKEDVKAIKAMFSSK